MLKTFWAVSGSNFQPLDYATIALGKGWSVNSVGCVFALEPILFVNAVKLYFYPLFNCVRIVKQNVNPVTN